MKQNLLRQLLLMCVILFGLALLSLPLIVMAQGPLDTSFTYQGRLLKGGSYVTGINCNFQFGLFDAPSSGAQLGATLTRTATLNQGFFNAKLDFGNVFTGSKRYLQVAVQCPPDAGFTPLGGRIEMNVTPYALYALNAVSAGQVNWSSIISIPAGFADNVDDEGGVSDFACNSGQILKWSGGAWSCAVDVGSQPNTVDHGGLLGLSDDDHPQYLLVSGTRPMAGNLNLANNRIINLITGTLANDAVTVQQAVKVGDAAGGDLIGTYPNPTVTRLRGFTISTNAPALGEVLIWNGSQWDPGNVLADGPAGGDLTGNYPNPQIAANAVGAAEIAADAVGLSEIAANAVDSSEIAADGVGSSEIAADAVGSSEIVANAVRMSELNVPMDSGETTGFDLSNGVTVYYVFPSDAPAFTPDADGECMVIASASLRSAGNSSVGAGFLRTARQAAAVNANDGAVGFEFGDSDWSPSVTVNYVWNVTGGESTRFGCYLQTNNNNVVDDEVIDCRVSYICQ